MQMVIKGKVQKTEPFLACFALECVVPGDSDVILLGMASPGAAGNLPQRMSRFRDHTKAIIDSLLHQHWQRCPDGLSAPNTP